MSSVSLAAAAALWVGLPIAALAQDASFERYIQDDRGVGHDIRDLQRQNSAFRLFGEGDRAVTGLRPTGNMEYYVTNTGIIDGAGLNIDSQPDLFGCPTCPRGQYFDVSPHYAASRADWDRLRLIATSLDNVLGAATPAGGYTVAYNQPTLGQREILASDLSFGILFSGARSTEDGGCQDFSAGGPSSNNIAAGLVLLAASNCTPTWPNVGGEPTFLGRHPVLAEAYQALQASLGSDFNFQFWRADPNLSDPDKFFGNFQTYGAYDDYNSTMLVRFGNVIPGQTGAPTDDGWPMGLRTDFDAFTYALPEVASSMIWQATITNRSEDVYGVGLDFEQLYVGYTFNPIRTQNAGFYFEPWRGALLTAEAGTGEPRCPGAEPPGIGNLCADGDIGFNGGVTGMVVLKSPIGDLRNVLLTCSTSENAERSATRAVPCPTEDFNDPLNPHAGDTITYNHFRMCPFGACSNNTVQANDRQLFGGVSANAADLLNGRAFSALTAGEQYFIFRNPNFPDLGPEATRFAYWVPGTWDYTANGSNGLLGDTLYVPTCYGEPGVAIPGLPARGPREHSCVVTWSDTMPRGELGNPAYDNREGNISFMSIGPFALAAGDTTSLVLALVAAPDSASFEREINNVISLYLNFYLTPEPPPRVTIVGTHVQIENPALGAGRGEVTLFWDDALDGFVDPFLDAFAGRRDGDFGRIHALNPDLEDRIRDRARDNLARILIFKSCDAGQTFTANDADGRGALDCDADPAEDEQGAPVGLGWQAYSTIPISAGQDPPNSFLDTRVTPGQRYLYAIVGESRGATFAIVDSLDVDGNGSFDRVGPDSLIVAPQLTNPLSRSTTDPNVVNVYVPASDQAGGQPFTASITVPDPARSTAPFFVVPTGAPTVDGTYRAIFGNDFVVERRDDAATGLTQSTSVILRDVVRAFVPPSSAEDRAIDSLQLVTANPNSVTITGTPDSVTLSSGGTVDTTRTFLSGRGFLLVLDVPGGSVEPLLVTTVLDGVNTTSPAFVGRVAEGPSTGFPGFLVNASGTLDGSFQAQFYLGALGQVVPTQIDPTLTWSSAASVARRSGGIPSFGVYVMDWVARTFGPATIFQLNTADPAATDADFDASIEARAVGETGRVDQTAADALSAALGVTVGTGDLVAVRVPFTVSNATFGRAADVAMRQRLNNNILLGAVGTPDTLSVSVAPDAWVPGDTLYFLESVQLDSVVDVGGSPAVVLDVNGDPIQNTRTVVTFGPAILSCGNSPRPSCNPVVGPGTTFDFVSNTSDQTHVVSYVAPFQLSSEITFDVQGPISGQDIIAGNRDIRSQLDSVVAVPNPYIMFSRYEVTTVNQDDARLMFTHLPPQGTLRIFTVAGRFVQQLRWGPTELAGNGDLFWNMRTKEGNEVGAGLYVFVVEAPNPATGGVEKKIGKFVVIR